MRTFLFLLLLTPGWLWGQNAWNVIPTLSLQYNAIRDLITDQDEIVVYGVGLSNDAVLTQGLVVAKVDTTGVVLKEVFLTDSLGDKFSVDDRWGKIIKCSTGGYAATAATVYRKSAFLIKLDDNLEVDFIKEYPDTVNFSNYWYSLQEVSGGYLLYGVIQYPDYYHRGFIKYVDYSGEIIWERRYFNSDYGTFIFDLQPLSDSTFVFSTSETLEPIVTGQLAVVRSGLYKINLAGDLLDAWQSEPTPEIGYLRKIIPLENGDLITYGTSRKGATQWNNLELVQPTIARLDADYNTVWLRNFGRVTGLSTKHLLDLERTPDGNFVGVGQLIVKNGTQPSRGHGWVYKFSPAGDSLWGRNFPTPFLPDEDPNGGILYGVGALSSGNLVAGGYAENGQSRFCWLVKLTNDGCMDTLFCLTSAVGQLATPTEQVRLYPNPAHEQVVLDWPRGERGTVRVLDQLGQVRLMQSVQSADNQVIVSTAQLPAGIYFVEIQVAAQTVQVAKMVVQH